MLKVTLLLLSIFCALTMASDTLIAQSTTYDGNYATISLVNVNLGADCSFTLQASNVLSGATASNPLPPDSLFNLIVNDADPSNGNIIDGCGDFGFTIEPKPNSGITNFRFGRGMVMARKTSPPLLFQPVAGATGLYTTQLQDLLVNNLAPSVPRTFEIDGTTGFPVTGTFQMALMSRLMIGGDLPRFVETCGNVLVTVSDRVFKGGACDDIIVTRTFMARSANSVCNMDVPMEDPDSGVGFYSYDIVLKRPSIGNVVAPPTTVAYSCDDPDIIPGITPEPALTDYPYFDGADGPIYLDDVFGNIGSSYSDSEPIQTCASTYKVVRTYTVIDWCRPDVVLTFPQVIKVGDLGGPVITRPTQDLDFNGIPDVGPMIFTTNAADCGAIINTNFGGIAVNDGCSGIATVQAFVLLNGDTSNLLGPVDVFSSRPGERLTPFIPLGDHILRYIASDGCQNESAVDVEITIEDRSGPVVIVEDALNVSLSSSGFAEVKATDLDEGSYDDCSAITLEIAFANPTSLQAIGAFGPSISLTCLDVGTVPVVVRATDANGNSNSQMSILNVIDNSAPVCVAPASIVLSCAQADDVLPEDVNAFFEGDPIGTINYFNENFGEPTSVDNCGNEVTSQLISSSINDCGTGQVIRTFTVTDARGFVSAPGCQQIITVRGVTDYTIEFPADVEVVCGETASYDGVEITENACDMLLVNTKVDTFRSESLACYELRITYEIINWCEYNENGSFISIPRDADNDGNVNESTFLHVSPNDNLDRDDDLAILDRDDRRNNDNSIGALTADYGTALSRGAFRYRQFIKVFDNEAPVITDVSTQVTNGEDCAGGDIDISYSVQDECSPADVSSRVELDLDYSSANGFSISRALTAGEISNDGRGNYLVSLTSLPAGEHAIRIRASDGCGNDAGRIISFTVESIATLSPICIDRLRFFLTHDGDGGGIVSVVASDFVRGANGNCNNSRIYYSIYRETEATQTGFQPRIGRTEFMADCTEEGAVAVRVYSLDGDERGDYCSATAFLEAVDDNVCDDSGLGSLAGFITSPRNDLLSDIEVHITDNSAMDDMMYTDDNGSFLFTGLKEGGEYMVRPAMPDVIDMSRVKTSDIIRIMEHILGLDPITDPYRMVAADVTGDGQIDITDMVSIRRIIVGMDETYRGPTWRFIRRDFELAGLEEGWDVSIFPTTFTIGHLEGHNRDADFVAIEIGDVHTEATGRGSLALNAEDRQLLAGETAEVTLSAGDMIGFQGTLQATDGLTLVGWKSTLMGAANVNDRELNSGLLSFSYNANHSLNEKEALVVTVRAEHDLLLSDYLYVSDRVAVSEGYQSTGGTSDLHIVFHDTPGGAGNCLHQNFPNPVADRTTIAFDLERSGPVALTIYDASGRMVTTRQLSGTSGRNELRLSTHDLKNTSGLLTYTLEVGEQRYSKRMLVVAR